MKRQIDPNLSNFGDDIIKNDESIIDKINNIAPKNDDEIEDILAGIKPKQDSKGSSEFNITDDKYVGSSTGRHHHHHHHSSSGEHHHHSSSGEHHHHSSNSGHHSSSQSSKHGHSHHHKSKKKKKMPTAVKIILIILIILLLIFFVVGGTFLYLQHNGKKEVTTITEDTQYQETIEYNGHTYQFNDNVVSVAFMGIDQRDMEESANYDFVGSADADIIVTIDTQTGVAKLIAIPRDTMVDVDIYSDNGMFLRTDNVQLCLAYAYGDGSTQSCDNVIKAVERILYNVPIQKYFALDLDGIKPLNDAIGGVTVDSLYDFPDLGIFKGQRVTLKGDMAEAYVRTRDMVDVNASLYRSQRQVQYVKAFANQVAPAVIKDFGTVTDLYNTAQDYSRTNMSLSGITYLASLVLSKGTTDFTTYTIEGTMKESTPTRFSEFVYAEFTPDEDSLMQTVLDVYYTQID